MSTPTQTLQKPPHGQTVQSETAQSRADAAVDALLGQLPTATTLTAKTVGDDFDAAAVGAAVVASFVGSTSADFAIALIDADALAADAGGDGPTVSIVDVLRPALESAADSLGTGVLGQGAVEESAALFDDADATVYELRKGRKVAGWAAVRLRENGTVADAPAHQDSSAHQDRSVVGKLGRISNVEMALTVEIGRTRMAVRDLLALEPGAVIELDRSAGAPADILLNGRLIAHGEVVVVDQDYAVRITTILDVADA